MRSPGPVAVLAAGTVVSSPALWRAFDGALPVDVALTRYLLAMAVCWGALALVRTFAWPDVRGERTPGRANSAEDPADRPDPAAFARPSGRTP